MLETKIQTRGYIRIYSLFGLSPNPLSIADAGSIVYRTREDAVRANAKSTRPFTVAEVTWPILESQDDMV